MSLEQTGRVGGGQNWKMYSHFTVCPFVLFVCIHVTFLKECYLNKQRKFWLESGKKKKEQKLRSQTAWFLRLAAV